MTYEEICRSYRLAANKSNQVNVLAELNDCSPQDIIDILTENGEISGMPKKKKSKSQRWTVDDEKKLIEYYENGIGNFEIAEKLGRDYKAVCDKIYNLKKKGYIHKDNQDKSIVQKLKTPAKTKPVDSNIDTLDLLFKLLELGKKYQLKARSLHQAESEMACVAFVDEDGIVWQCECKDE